MKGFCRTLGLYSARPSRFMSITYFKFSLLPSSADSGGIIAGIATSPTGSLQQKANYSSYELKKGLFH